uniref:Uncharacterized protein n=1 Tax=Cucumis sativus TaxID=3659 RepID=A0A0A0KJA2_CUCSA
MEDGMPGAGPLHTAAALARLRLSGCPRTLHSQLPQIYSSHELPAAPSVSPSILSYLSLSFSLRITEVQPLHAVGEIAPPSFIVQIPK